MRISVDEADPGYDEKWHFSDVRITVDGNEVLNVQTADTTTGYVKFWDKMPSKGGQLVEIHGKVEIIGDLT